MAVWAICWSLSILTLFCIVRILITVTDIPHNSKTYKTLMWGYFTTNLQILISTLLLLYHYNPRTAKKSTTIKQLRVYSCNTCMLSNNINCKDNNY